MHKPSANSVTDLLRAWGQGSQEAGEQLFGLVYDDLHRRAARYLRRERPGHTLQPTALVHEAYLRLAGQHQIVWQNRAQFLGVASQVMRRVLVDHARHHQRGKRSGGWVRVTLDEAIADGGPRHVDLLALDAALTKLAEQDQRKSRIVELRYFGGLSETDIAHAVGISVATVRRDWTAARAWLYRQVRLGQSRPDHPESQ